MCVASFLVFGQFLGAFFGLGKMGTFGQSLLFCERIFKDVRYSGTGKKAGASFLGPKSDMVSFFVLQKLDTCVFSLQQFYGCPLFWGEKKGGSCGFWPQN